MDLGRLNKERGNAIVEAAEAIGRGEHVEHFPVDIFQTGSGTSTNMNANEVIANLVCVAKGVAIGSSKDADYLGDQETGAGVHPNDHVNMGQSSNDTFPTAIHIAAAHDTHASLIPALTRLADELENKAKAWDGIVKIGRTHLQDATPLRLGQEFAGYAQQARYGVSRAERALEALPTLRDGHVEASDLDEVILVGGATRMPVVIDFVRETLGHEPRIELDPDQVVAMGAAVQAALIVDDEATMREVMGRQ